MSEKRFTSKQIIPPILSLALFMETLDATIINTAIPTMARSLGVGPIDLKLALISYLLSLAIFIPISGWLVDKLGARRVFISALSIFTLSSIACGLAHNLMFLIIARTVQGFGGAMMGPVARLIIVRMFARTELLKAMNRIITVMLIGPALGPVLGGYITHYFSWRWIFYVNVPFGILAIVMSWIWLENYRAEQSRPLDVIGFLLFGFSAAALTFGLSALSESFIAPARATMFIGFGVAGLIAYYLHSRYQRFPLLPLNLFAWRTFRVGITGNMLFRLIQGAMAFGIPLFLQLGLGYPPQIAGLLLMPVAIGAMAGKSVVRAALQRWGYQRWLMINGALMAISTWLYAINSPLLNTWILVLIALFYGVWISTLMSSMNTLLYAEIPAESSGSANTFFNIVQQLCQSIGVAIGALLLKYFSQLPNGQHVFAPHVFQHVFLILGVMTLASSLVFTGLQRDDARALIG